MQQKLPTTYDVLTQKYQSAKRLYDQTIVLFDELAHYFRPPSTGFGGGANYTGFTNPTGQAYGELYDSTGVEASQMLVSFIIGALFNPTQEWSAVLLPTHIQRNKQISDAAKTRILEYISLVNKSCLEYVIDPSVNFYSSLERALMEAVVFGAGFMLADAHPVTKHLRFRHVPLQNLMVERDEDGEANTIFRLFTLSVREVMERWPAEKLPHGEYPKAWTEPKFNRDQMVNLCHAVIPHDPFMKVSDSKNMPKTSKRFRGYYYIPKEQITITHPGKDKADAHDVILDIGGFDRNPYIGITWQWFGNELVPSSPARNALPTMRNINDQYRNFKNGSEMQARPPFFAVANAISGGSPQLGTLHNTNTIDPGMFEAAGGDIRKLVQYLVAPIDLQYTMMDIQNERDAVRRMFFNDKIASSDKAAEMREVEVNDKIQERMRAVMVPQMRMYDQIASPVMTLVAEYMIKTGAVAPPSTEVELAHKKFGELHTFRFNAATARAFSQLELDTMNRVAQQFLLPLSQIFPEVLDTINILEYTRAVYELAGINPAFMRTKEEFDAIQQQKQEQAEAETQANNLQAGAAGIKDLAQAQALGGSF